MVAFGYAAFLALRLLQGDEVVRINGWSELRHSIVEYFACYGAVALAIVLLSAVILIGGSRPIPATQLLTTLLPSLLLGGGVLGIGLCGLFTRVRWNNTRLEHSTALGRQTVIVWSNVRSVWPNWRGITIATYVSERVTFSQFHAGAAQLAIHATNRARRNTQSASQALATP
ncbi:MAG: hypothetical protein MO846_10295 [Candidatus Devosia symbiotica]|nr:hypothetical protein [Candidatus Devosia symbiotica]